MWQFIVRILITEIIKAVSKAASDYMTLKRKSKENKSTAKEVMSEKDPKVRAKRIADFLNS